MNYDIAYAAMCMWEEVLTMRERPDVTATFEGLGTCTVRDLILSFAEKLNADYPEDYEDSFDWEFVPDWMHTNLEWFPHNIQLKAKPDYFHLGRDAE